MSKDAYTIGEIARIYHIGTDTIRYYERKGLLEPVRGENGYRYYSGHTRYCVLSGDKGKPAVSN